MTEPLPPPQVSVAVGMVRDPRITNPSWFTTFIFVIDVNPVCQRWVRPGPTSKLKLS
jgi:hypothetical protein